jgi:competence protein ComEC
MSKKEIILIIILLCIALIRYLFFIPKIEVNQELLNQTVFFEALIVENPDIRLYNKHLITKPINHTTNILIITDRETTSNYGDIIKVTGKLKRPENFLTDTGKEFNYQAYLARRDIYYTMTNPLVEVISTGHGNKIKQSLFTLRNLFIENIEKLISRPESDLANGLLLGTRGNFDHDLNQKFINTGTIHIVALSGYNITIISDNILKFFSLFLPSIFATFFAVLIIILFIIMTGASATSVRAGIMALIVLFARVTGRNYQAGRALFIAGFLMIVYDPRTIVDLSFQLSFLATIGILFLTPKVNKWFYFLPDTLKIKEIVSTTTSATLAVLPLLLHQTGIFSVVSLPTNILILPFIPLAMFFSFLTGMITFISSFFALPFAIIGEFILSYMLLIVDFFASLSFSYFSLPLFPLSLSLLFYLFLFLYIRK